MKTFRHSGFEIRSAACAVAAVSALLLLQAYSLSTSESQPRAVELKTLALPRERQNASRTKDAAAVPEISVSGVSAARALPVVDMNFSGGKISLPPPSFAGAKGSLIGGDFSIAAFAPSGGADAQIETFSLDMLDKIPRRIDSSRVEYPKHMLKRGIEGDVSLLVLIDTSGAVSVEKVVSATNKFFAESAVAAAKNFVYESPTKNGRAVRARFVLPIPFRISK